MIKFVPVTSDKLGEPFSSDSTLCGYIGYDYDADGAQCGKCVFRLNGYTMDVCFVEALDSDAETEEGLIRSALNYVYIFRSITKILSSIFLRIKCSRFINIFKYFTII